MLLVNAGGECIRYDSIEKMSTLIILYRTGDTMDVMDVTATQVSK